MSFNHSILPNGLNLVTYEMPYIDSVVINIIINVGSRYENDNQRGITHFLEHMAFKGTKNRTKWQIAKEFDEIGGYFNAYTSREHTVFYSKTLSKFFPNALDILADILQYSIFEESEIQKEFEVISQEIAEVQDTPDELAHDTLYEIAYPEQSLGQSILGTQGQIARINQKSLAEYTKQYYTANNITISIAGKISHAEAQKYIDSLFTSLPVNKSDIAYSTAKYQGGYHFIEKPLEQTTYVMAFEAPCYKELDLFYQAQLLSVIFGGSFSSRLFQKIREEMGLAYSIGSWCNSFSDTGLFGISTSCHPSKVEILHDAILFEINATKGNISQDELNRAKTQIESSILMAEEKPEYKSEEMGKNFALFQSFFPKERTISAINNITLSDLEVMSSKIFSSASTIVKIGKKG